MVCVSVWRTSVACITLLLFVVTTHVESFAPPQKIRSNVARCHATVVSRSDFIKVGAAVFVLAGPANAQETSITACKVVGGGKPTNCISTASIKQVDCYAPPWTFEVTPQEVMARLKGLVASDPTLELISESTNYIKIRTPRGLVTDEIEFLVNADDKVVTFKSGEVLGEDATSATISDFGANRKRLEDLRKKSNVFGVMGDGLTADSYAGGRGTGPLGQLKAFYGLQSGKGFEEVFEDD